MPRLLLVAAALMLTTPAFAQEPDASPGFAREQELRDWILAATKAADFKRSMMGLEVYRTLRGAGVTLTSAEAFEMGQNARMRGLAGEAADAFALLDSDDPEYRGNELMIASLKERAAGDLAGEAEQAAKAVGQRNRADYAVMVAEAFADVGDFERATEFYQMVLNRNQPGPNDADTRAAEASKIYDRSIEFYQLEFKEHPCSWAGYLLWRLCPTDLALVQLNYGISLFKLGRVADARATWSAITGSESIAILARAWIGIADRSAN